jgi:predicted negative regulator of RcsB-dependent stress response
MKTSERHHLKEDAFLTGLDRTRGVFAENRRNISLVGTIVLLAILIVAGYVFWRSARNERAATLLADAMVTVEAPIVPPQPPGQLNPQPVPTHSFPTERARLEAALPKLDAVAAAYPKTKAGIAATYRAAGLLVDAGRPADAEQRFNQVVALDANGVYGRMAQLGLASLQIQAKKYDQAISTLQPLSQRTDGDLPVDGILMQLGHAYRAAGRTPDAVRTFTRIVDEFPQSAYATDARRQLDELKTTPAAARS